MSIADRNFGVKPSTGRDMLDEHMSEEMPYEAYGTGQGGQGREASGNGHLGRAKRLASAIPADVLVVVIVILAASAGFGLGMLADRSLHGTPGEGISVENLPASALVGAQTADASSTATPVKSVSAQAPKPALLTSGSFVASKTGKAFYLTTCSGAARIKDENKVYFASEAAAESAGYAPAKNCKGL